MDRARTESGEYVGACAAQCLDAIAAELGCTAERLPKGIIAAVAAFGLQLGQHAQREADLAATTTPPAGRYRVQPEEITRVTGTRPRR